MPERFVVEQRKDCYLLWNERDFSMPRRCVASFPNHPYDKHESSILAEICAAALNRELPGQATGTWETPKPKPNPRPQACSVPGPDPTPAPAAPAPEPSTPAQAAPLYPPADRPAKKSMPDISKLQGRAKVQAMRKSLFGSEA